MNSDITKEINNAMFQSSETIIACMLIHTHKMTRNNEKQNQVLIPTITIYFAAATKLISIILPEQCQLSVRYEQLTLKFALEHTHTHDYTSII